MDLRQHLPEAIPLALAWAIQHEKIIQGQGRELTLRETEIARKMQVEHPERVRILFVPKAPEFDHPRLRQLADIAGYPTEAAGVAYGYGIYICAGFESDEKVLAHELRHVAQLEKFSSTAAFVKAMCEEVAEHGYYDAPMEIDARKWSEYLTEQAGNLETASLVSTLCTVAVVAGGLYLLGSLLPKSVGKS